MNTDTLSALEAAIERQTKAFDEATKTLTDLGEVELRVPQALLDELAELTTSTQTHVDTMPLHGIRA